MFLLTEKEFFTYQRLLESSNRTAIVTFGRMNPVTVGHVKLMEKLKELGRKYSAVPTVYLSHTQDAKKNPLTYEQKVKYAKLAAPAGVTIMVSNTVKSVADVFKHLGTLGVKTCVFVAGSDRVTEYQKFEKWMKDFNGLEEIKVVSAGERDPDADDVSGMSASKLRAVAVAGKQDEFIRGAGVKDKTKALEMYRDVRKGMGIS